MTRSTPATRRFWWSICRTYFVAEGFPLEVPIARAIVPNINRMANAMRTAGGAVVWIQTTSAGALEHWGNHHTYMLTPERAARRLAGLDEASDGYKLFPALEPSPTDLRVKKITYSAFIAGSSDIDVELESSRHRQFASDRDTDKHLLRVDGA